MADLLVPLLIEPDNKIFKKICKMLFHDYGGSKGYLTKTELKKPIGEITKELYQTKLTSDIFETLYRDIQKKDKNKVKLREFQSIVKYLILSLISYAERINGTSNVDIMIETSQDDKYAEILLVPPNNSTFQFGIGTSEEGFKESNAEGNILFEDEIIKLPKKKKSNKDNISDIFNGDDNIRKMLEELEDLSDETDSDSDSGFD